MFGARVLYIQIWASVAAPSLPSAGAGAIRWRTARVIFQGPAHSAISFLMHHASSAKGKKIHSSLGSGLQLHFQFTLTSA